jgi:hypothetical protein
MKKYELSEEELRTLIGVAVADICSQKKFEKDSDVITEAAAVITFKIENHLNGTAPFPKEELEYSRKIVEMGEAASSLLKMIFGGI